MKKFLSVFLALIVIAASLTACGNTGTNNNNENKISIVTTIFPEYDWVKEILGEKADSADITMLLDNGADLHSYQPTAKDISKIAECDLFIYVGGESDEWVEDALSEATNKNMEVINLMNVLGSNVKEEEFIEGMQDEDGHDHDDRSDVDDKHDHDGIADADDKHDDMNEHHDMDEDTEYDEHVWLSLKNTAILCDAIAEAIKRIDPENASVYDENVSAYKEKVNALDMEYEETVNKADVKTVLFGDRFPFRYLVDDYGLNYYAAFVGCSAETEASFKTIKFLADKVDELKLKSVMTIEGPNHKIAETIIENTRSKDQKILTMDSMQSTTVQDIKEGATYLSIMQSNLEVLKEALK